MNLKNAKLLSLIISLLLIFNSKAISSIITYKEILDDDFNHFEPRQRIFDLSDEQ